MLIRGDGFRIYLACGDTDMRKSINGLSLTVQESFKLDPFEKALFVFCNKPRNRMKILTWEENGFWLHFRLKEFSTVENSSAILPWLHTGDQRSSNFFMILFLSPGHGA